MIYTYKLFKAFPLYYMYWDGSIVLKVRPVAYHPGQIILLNIIKKPTKVYLLQLLFIELYNLSLITLTQVTFFHLANISIHHHTETRGKGCLLRHIILGHIILGRQ